MNDTNSLAHTKWNCKYHIVFAPKYRRKVFFGEKRREIGKILRQLCEWKKVNIVEAEVCPDHIHMMVSIPPKLSVAEFMGYLKGKSTLMLYDRHPELQSKWDKAFWARGYYVETIGNITDEAVQKYIKEQAEAILDRLGIPVSVFIDMTYRQVIMRDGVPFSLDIPDKLVTRDSITQAEFDTMMQTGLAQAKKNDSVSVDEAFNQLKSEI